MVKTKKSEETQNYLYQVALNLFRKNDFDKTTMRKIAKESQMSLGASYYHFKSKEEIILKYYEEMLSKAEEENKNILHETKKIDERLKKVLLFQFSQFSEDRSLLIALARKSVDANHHLSPFSQETSKIRETSIKIFEEIIENSDLVAHKKLKPLLAETFWIFQMAIIFYWLIDPSEKQKNTFQLLDKSIDFLISSIRLTLLPLPQVKENVKQLTSILELIMIGLNFKDQ